MGKPRVVAIIQARMGSTRLPGKVLMLLAGKPVLWHIVQRLRKCRMVDVIAIATSIAPQDDPIVLWAAENGIQAVRGPEDNVLQRFALAAAELNPDVIVRVTGDAPLIDPKTIDRLVETLISRNADYCIGAKGVPSIHEGFCPFTRVALSRLLHEAAHDPVAVEHVTAYFKQHPEDFYIVEIPIFAEHQFTGARLSVDTPADLGFMEAIYQYLGVPAGDADVSDVVRLLRNMPELLDINSHIYQKKATDRTIKIMVRCDGDSFVGLGHVVRCLALADELREKHGCGILFAMKSGEAGMELVRKKGFPVSLCPVGQSEDEWLAKLVDEQMPNAMVLDNRTDLSCSLVRSWRSAGILIASIDDPSDRRLEADLAFYPPVPQLKKMVWDGFSGELFVGWEWVILRREFSLPVQRKSSVPLRILVTMGGSDPAGLTLRVLKTLDAINADFEISIIIGAAFSFHEQLSEILKTLKHTFTLDSNVQDMKQLMERADLAIASFGVTAYELAAVGLPAIFLCLSEDHANSASSFEEAGIAINLGVCHNIDDATLESATKNMLYNADLRNDMERAAKALVDGNGSARIAQVLVDKVNNKIMDISKGAMHE